MGISGKPHTLVKRSISAAKGQFKQKFLTLSLGGVQPSLGLPPSRTSLALAKHACDSGGPDRRQKSRFIWGDRVLQTSWMQVGRGSLNHNRHPELCPERGR